MLFSTLKPSDETVASQQSGAQVCVARELLPIPLTAQTLEAQAHAQVCLHLCCCSRQDYNYVMGNGEMQAVANAAKVCAAQSLKLGPSAESNKFRWEGLAWSLCNSEQECSLVSVLPDLVCPTGHAGCCWSGLVEVGALVPYIHPSDVKMLDF